jgi:hypothetical protein
MSLNADNGNCINDYGNRDNCSLYYTLELSGIDILISVLDWDRDWGKTSESVLDRDRKQLRDFLRFHIFPTKTMLSICKASNIYCTLVIMNYVHDCLIMFRHLTLQFRL